MTKQRNRNIIKALQSEIRYYKSQPIKCQVVNIPLKHLRVRSFIAESEIKSIPKDYIPKIITMRMARAIEDGINQLPIDTNYNHELRRYDITLDLWIDTNNNYK